MQRRPAGEVQILAPGLRGIIAPNPGPMTHWGTNTFIVGEDEVAVVDPGPALPSHMEALHTALSGQTVSHILVTHAHLDHSPGAAALSAATGAPVYGFGTATAGRRPVMENLVVAGLAGGGEGVDSRFAPDVILGDGDRVEGNGWRMTALHTPGHFAGHLAFRFENHLLSGDHVMDWSSSLVSPPDGDLAAFMATSRRLRDMDTLIFHPAHGGALSAPAERLDWLISHRLSREAALLDALTGRAQSIRDLTARVYTDTPQAMLPAAERNVFAHLIDLVERNVVSAEPELSLNATYVRL